MKSAYLPGLRLGIESEGYLKLARMLADGRLETFEDALQAFLGQATSFRQTGTKKAEVFYSGFMLCLLSTLSTYYTIHSEQEGGQGLADALLIPKPSQGHEALILEYKVSPQTKALNKVAQGGLAQIFDKDYLQGLEQYEHVRSVVGVCLAFSGKQVAMAQTKQNLSPR